RGVTRPPAGTVALVLVGDELLAGHVADANGPWLGRRVAEAGLRVTSAALVPDDAAAVARAIEHGLDDARTVVVTGGLGPTSDDVTRPALALLAGDRPAGELPNVRGSEPGVRLDLARGTVYAVPGVPGEMRAMAEDQVLPAVLRDVVAAAGAVPRRATRSLLVVGMREMEVAATLASLVAGLPGAVVGRLAYLPRPGEIEVRIQVTGPDAERSAAMVAVRARHLLGDAVAAQDGRLEDAVVATLLSAGATAATAESLTGGLLAGALVSVPGASAVLRGGVVAYATDLKAALLDVPHALLDRHGPVAAETAAAMAEGVRLRCGSTFGVATTGVAGPGPQDGQPAGRFYVAVVADDVVRVASRDPSPHFVADRETIRRLAVVSGLDLLRRAADGLGPGPGESSGPQTR
ncbi:MAG: nicotinamide-nucleotide amidohydrolase family protein, partial [Jiangellaceae bacterium]